MSLSVTTPVSNPTAKLKLDQSSGNTLNSQVFTLMAWAYHTGGTAEAYQDILTLRDSSVGGGDSDDQVVGLGTHVVSSVRVLNLGDVDTDVDGVQAILDNEWHHFALVGELVPNSGSPAQRTRLTGYLDGIQVVRSTDTEMTPPLFPDSLCWVQLFNSRSSDTDNASVFIGSMAACKIWSNVALTPREIWEEMWSYWPVRRKDVWAVAPMHDLGSAGFNYLGADFTVQGADFLTGALDPPIPYDAPMSRRSVSNFFSAPARKFLLNRP